MKYPELPTNLSHAELIQWMVENGEPDTPFEKIVAKKDEPCSDIEAFADDFIAELEQCWQHLAIARDYADRKRLLTTPEMHAGLGIAFLKLAATRFACVLATTTPAKFDSIIATFYAKLKACADDALNAIQARAEFEKEQRRLDEEIKQFKSENPDNKAA